MSCPDKARLVALASGCHPHSDPLDCEDLRGARSLFGESAGVPRPLCGWSAAADRQNCPSDLERKYDGCHVLWEGETGISAREEAERIYCTGGSAAADMLQDLSVPSRTFIAGRCTSTFSVAWGLMDDGLLPEWGALIASCQTEGRGQMRRRWYSPRGNLYASFRLPDDPLFRSDAGALVTGYLLAQALRALGFPIFLKWPNDLLLAEEGKVGGILLEERNGVTLAGLGINLSEAPPAALLREQQFVPAAVLLPYCHEGMDQKGGKAFHSRMPVADAAFGGEEPLAPFALWRRLASGMILAYFHLVRRQSLSQILSGIEEVLAWKGKSVILADGNGDALSGLFLGVGPRGGLMLRSQGGTCEHFSGSLYLAGRAV